MVGNVIGGRGPGRSQGSGGGGVISTVDASITWAKTTLTTEPPAYINGDIGQVFSPEYVNVYNGRPGVLYIGCATTTLNAS